MLQGQKYKNKLESGVQKAPWILRVKVKFSLLILFLSIAPLVVVSYFLFTSYSNSLEKQVVDNLLLVAESKEGHLFSFIDKIIGTTVDFSSDGFIRDAVEEFTSNPENTEVLEQLNNHLRVNKLPIAGGSYGINIFSLDGVTIASTNDAEIGKDESGEDYFNRAVNLPYGEALMSDIEISYHFLTDQPSIIISAPLTNKATGKKIGVITNHYFSNEIDDILTGQKQLDLGALSGRQGAQDTLDSYLVNSEMKIITESRFMDKKTFLDKSFPVQACLKSTEEVSGEWIDYRGVDVYGASMCILQQGHNWTLIVKVDESEILAPIFLLESIFILVVTLSAIIILLVGIYFLNKLIRPIEELTDTSRRISNGDLSLQAKVYSKDEIGQLARSFNQMTESLIQVSEESKSIVRILPDPLFILDKTGKITAANPKAQKILNLPNQNIYTQELAKLFKGRKKNGKKLKSFSSKKVVIDKFVFEAFVTDVPNHKQATIRALIILHDITHATAVDRMKTEFISVASHQLRTPLTSMIWNIEMLLSNDFGKLNKGQKEVMQEVFVGGNRMVKLVNDLLNVSRLESGRLRIDPEPIDLNKLIRDIIEEHKQISSSKNCKLTLTIQPGFPKKISLDRTLTRQVIQNLIVNAIRYSPQGKKGLVVIKTEKKDGAILVSVKDNGIGIPQLVQSRVFEKFFRADNAIKASTEGTGLGLYLSKLIMDASGGKIWFESSTDKGATFYIQIPAKGMKVVKGDRGLS